MKKLYNDRRDFLIKGELKKEKTINVENYPISRNTNSFYLYIDKKIFSNKELNIKITNCIFGVEVNIHEFQKIKSNRTIHCNLRMPNFQETHNVFIRCDFTSNNKIYQTKFYDISNLMTHDYSNKDYHFHFKNLNEIEYFKHDMLNRFISFIISMLIIFSIKITDKAFLGYLVFLIFILLLTILK